MLPSTGAGSSGFHGGQGKAGKRGGSSPPATPPNKRACGNPAAASTTKAKAGGATAKAGPVTLKLVLSYGICLAFAQVKHLFPSLIKSTEKATQQGFLDAPDGEGVIVSVKEPSAPAGRQEHGARLVYSKLRKWRLLGLEDLNLCGRTQYGCMDVTAWVNSAGRLMMDPVGAEPAAVLGGNAAGANSAAAAAQAPAPSTARDTRASPTALPRTNSPAGKSYFTGGTIPAAAAAPFVTVPAGPIGDAAGDASATTASAARADGASSAAVDSSGGRAARAAPATPAAPIIAAGAASAASNVITASAAATAGAAPAVSASAHTSAAHAAAAAPATPTAGANSTVAASPPISASSAAGATTSPPNSASAAPGAASAATTATADPAARSTPDISAAIYRAVADATVALNRSAADAVTATSGFICLVLRMCYMTAGPSKVLLLVVDGLMAPPLDSGEELKPWVAGVATFAGRTAIEYRVVRPGNVERGASGPLAVAVRFDAAVTVEVVEMLRSRLAAAVPLSHFPTNKAMLDRFLEAAKEHLPVGDEAARTVGMHPLRAQLHKILEHSAKVISV